MEKSKLPEKYWYTIEELAIHWECSVDYIKHFIAFGDLIPSIKNPDSIKTRTLPSGIDIQKVLQGKSELKPDRLVIRRGDMKKFLDSKNDIHKKSGDHLEESTRHSDSLKLIIYAMATKQFRYNADDKKSPTTQNILNSIQELGLKMSLTTIKKALDESTEVFFAL
jgi:hypothetical protein